MSVAISELGVVSYDANQASYTKSSITAATTDIVLVATAFISADVQSVSDNGPGLTYAKLKSFGDIELWYARVTSALSGNTITVTLTGTAFGGGIGVYKITPASLGATNGLENFGTPATEVNVPSTENSPTVAAWGDAANNAIFHLCVVFGAATLTEEGGYTVGTGFGDQTENAIKARCQWEIGSGDVTPTFTFSSFNNQGIAVEVIDDAGAASGVSKRGFPRGVSRAFERGISHMVNLNGLWRPRDTRLMIPVGIALQGA